MRRGLVAFGAFVLAVSLAGTGLTLLSRSMRARRYDAMTKLDGTYDGLTKKVTRSGSSRSVTCTRWYRVKIDGRSRRLPSYQAPCSVWIGPDPDVGDDVEVGIKSRRARSCLTPVEVEGVSATLALAPVSMLFGLVFLVVGLVMKPKEQAPPRP